MLRIKNYDESISAAFQFKQGKDILLDDGQKRSRKSVQVFHMRQDQTVELPKTLKESKRIENSNKQWKNAKRSMVLSQQGKGLKVSI